MNKLTITQPDDWHCHLRDNDFLLTTVGASAHSFARAIVMPNLMDPVTDKTKVQAYRQRIIQAIPGTTFFTPLMTLYLTDHSNAKIITEAKDDIVAAKLYPAGATTHSAKGVTDIKHIHSALTTMSELGIPLLIHGEVTDANVDIFDREKVFIDTVLKPLIKQYPQLKIVLEHITTKDAVDFVLSAPDNVAATITVHHLLLDRNDLLAGGIKPHYYCLPILKRNIHQQALINAAISGNKKFFLGTDSAPHLQSKKESACGCAGIFSAHAALELYAEVFEQHNALSQLESFASFNGADFYGLPRNKAKITLTKKSWKVPEKIVFGNDVVIPLRAGETVAWQVTA